MTKRRFLNVLIVLAIAILSVVYYIYDGAYVIETMTSDELELINKYATYKTPFSDKTIVKDFVLADDLNSRFWRHDQYIHATLLVPNDEIDNVFPEKLRNYDIDADMDLTRSSDDIVFFKIWMPRTVVKWPDKTSRSINYNVLISGDKYTKVYMVVSKLGWNLYNYKQI